MKLKALTWKGHRKGHTNWTYLGMKSCEARSRMEELRRTGSNLLHGARRRKAKNEQTVSKGSTQKRFRFQNAKGTRGRHLQPARREKGSEMGKR